MIRQFNIDGGNKRSLVSYEVLVFASCSVEPPFLNTKARLLNWGRALTMRRKGVHYAL